jgi:branched-chain amino acid transport system ATP-binding protein
MGRRSASGAGGARGGPDGGVLELDDVAVFYGAVHALKGISLRVAPGEIVTLIGSNGAGKSTALRAISGLVRARSGSIRFDGMSLTNRKPHEVVSAGISHAPEGRHVFANLTVRENLMMGAYLRKDREGIARDLEHVVALFPRLKERSAQRAGTLSGGEQQMLAIGRALMARPRVLLLDEPSLGLAPLLVREIFRKIESINRDGTTILLVEQNAHLALRIAHRGYVLETGRIVLEGAAADLAGNEEVRKAYLGAGG